MKRTPTLVERIRFEAHMASRAGQLEKLERIADEVDEMFARLEALPHIWESMAGPANSVYETCARDLRSALAAEAPR